MKFLVLYYSPPEAMAKMQTTPPEEMQAEMQRWMKWFEGLGDKLIEMGEMLTQGTELSSDGFTDCSGKVTGYSLIEADSFDNAKKLLEDHPHITWHEGCTVELYEQMEQPTQ